MTSDIASSPLSLFVPVCLIVFSVLVCAQLGSAGAKETVIYNFCSGCQSPYMPWDGLAVDDSGNLYGAALGGLFELSPPSTQGGAWTGELLCGCAVAGTPVFGTGGHLFYVNGGSVGVTLGGGVQELTPPAKPGGQWTASEVWFPRFPAQGTNLNAELVFRNGNLYGTAISGGNLAACGGNGCGVVFQLVQQANGSWKENILHRFGGGTADGAQPSAGLVFLNGVIYGTTSSGGANGYGTFYKLAVESGAWTETILYNFTSLNGGPGGLLADTSGNFFGPAHPLATPGIIFELTPPASPGGAWQENTIYAFKGKGDGAAPNAPLWRDRLGDLYGTTMAGAGWCGGFQCGAVFKLKAPATAGDPWTLMVLHDFGKVPEDGVLPTGGLTFHNGVFYGTTFYGGGGFDGKGDDAAGTVFSIVP